MKKIFAIVLLLGLIMYGTYTAFQSFGKEELIVGLEEGNIAPNFTLENMDGQQMSLSDLRGKKVLINFWASWCPPCEEEMPDMIKFYNDNKNKDIEILAINLTKYEIKFSDVEKFHDKYDLPFPVLLDREEKVSSLYQILTIPTSYFVDSEGRIKEKVSGPMDYKMIEEAFNEIN